MIQVVELMGVWSLGRVKLLVLHELSSSKQETPMVEKVGESGYLSLHFAWIGSVVNLKVEDYYLSGKRFLLRFREAAQAIVKLRLQHSLRQNRSDFASHMG
jgi:hypothetical protein